MPTTPINYWTWLFRARSGGPGWKRVTDWWLAVHFVVGLAISHFVTVPLNEAAKAVLLPMVGVFVGMSFAWVGTALSIVQTPEIDAMAEQHPGGIEAYVYPFQTAILILLISLSAWGIAGLGVFEGTCFFNCPSWGYRAMSVCLYGFASLTLRECWHVVLGSQMLLLYQRAVRRLPRG
jgi:hypothetical protein